MYGAFGVKLIIAFLAPSFCSIVGTGWWPGQGRARSALQRRVVRRALEADDNLPHAVLRSESLLAFGAALRRAASCSDLPRGARHRARNLAPQACIRWIRDPDHDAAMRIGGEAPGRRPILSERPGSHPLLRDTATSDRHRRPSREARRTPNLLFVCALCAHAAGRRTTPAGTSPVVTMRHRAINSLRARATIIVLR